CKPNGRHQPILPKMGQLTTGASYSSRAARRKRPPNTPRRTTRTQGAAEGTAVMDEQPLSRGMDRWVTDFIGRYFISGSTAGSLRTIMLLAAFAQGAIATAAFVLL